jgi:hypothetical protein
MAIISLSYNTEDKKVSCAVDGKDMEEMSYFCLSKYKDDEVYLEMAMEPQKVNGVTTYTRVVASDNTKNYQNTVSFSKDNTLVKVDGVKDIKASVANWLGFYK